MHYMEWRAEWALKGVSLTQLIGPPNVREEHEPLAAAPSQPPPMMQTTTSSVASMLHIPKPGLPKVLRPPLPGLCSRRGRARSTEAPGKAAASAAHAAAICAHALNRSASGLEGGLRPFLVLSWTTAQLSALPELTAGDKLSLKLYVMGTAAGAARHAVGEHGIVLPTNLRDIQGVRSLGGYDSVASEVSMDGRTWTVTALEAGRVGQQIAMQRAAGVCCQSQCSNPLHTTTISRSDSHSAMSDVPSGV